MRSSSRKLAYASPIWRASEPSGASPLLASAMRSAVRFAVSSVSMENMPKTARSGGISVLSYQPPFANRKKSSPGFTERSIPSRSRPEAEGPAAFLAGACAVVAAGPPLFEEVEAHAAARSAAHGSGRNDLALGFMHRRLARHALSRK